MSFSPNSLLCSKNYPRDISYMPVYSVKYPTYLTGVVIFSVCLDFEKNCDFRTAS